MIDREALAELPTRLRDAATYGYMPARVRALLNEAADALTSAGEGAVPVGEPCPFCKGRGTEADYIGADMKCVEVECSFCRGTGYAAPHPPRQDGAREGGLSQQFAETIDWIDQAGVVSDGQLETLHKACDRLNFLEATSTPAPDEAVEERELIDALAFFDRVKSSSQREQIAVGQDHWNRLDAATRAMVALLRSRRDVGGGV